MVAASATGSAFAVDAGGNSSFEVTANTREGGASTPILAPLQIVPVPKPALVSGSASPGRVRVGKRVTVTFALRNPNTTTTLTGLGLACVRRAGWRSRRAAPPPTRATGTRPSVAVC